VSTFLYGRVGTSLTSTGYIIYVLCVRTSSSDCICTKSVHLIVVYLPSLHCTHIYVPIVYIYLYVVRVCTSVCTCTKSVRVCTSVCLCMYRWCTYSVCVISLAIADAVAAFTVAVAVAVTKCPDRQLLHCVVQ